MKDKPVFIGGFRVPDELADKPMKTPTDDEIRIGLAKAFDDMTDANIAAALEVEKIGRKLRGIRRDSFSALSVYEELDRAKYSKDYNQDIPNYLSDLNAIHRLEEKLSDEQYGRFYAALIAMTQTGRPISSDARTRALALWEVVK